MSSFFQQNRMEMKATLSEDRLAVVIEMHMNGNPLGHIILDAAELSQVIENLGRARASMADEVARDIDPDSRMETVLDPAWRTRRPPPGSTPVEGPLLVLRNPGLGWLSFLLPDKEARDLGHWLIENTPTPPETDVAPS